MEGRKCLCKIHKVCAKAREKTILKAEELGAGIELFRLACQLDFEGVVAKTANSPYEDNARMG